VQSATSGRGKDGVILTSPISVQFYAPQKTKTFFSYLGKATSGFVTAPTDPIVIIDVVIGDTSYHPGSTIITEIVNKFFTQQVVQTLRSPEIVSGKYWQNISQKTLGYTAWIFDTAAGDYIVMYAPGNGYIVGNNLTMTDGTFTAVIQVASVGIGNSVVGFTVTSNTFNYTTPSPIMTSGGSGAGAAFYNYHIV
jgi:hypothetical protein